MALRRLPIRTQALRIRRFVPADTDAVFALSNEETARTWLRDQVYPDRAHTRSVLEFLIGQYAAPGNPRYGPYVLAIEHRLDGLLIGHVGFGPLDGEVEIGFAIAQSYQGQGLATEAVAAASRWALQAFELDRILGIAAVANAASRRVLTRARFAYTGDRRMSFQGAEQDVSVYVLCRAAGETQAVCG